MNFKTADATIEVRRVRAEIDRLQKEGDAMRAETAALNAATDETQRQRENADEAPDAIGIARAELAASSQSAWKGDNKLQPGMTADIVALLAIEADLIEADVIERERLATREEVSEPGGRPRR